MANRKNRQTRKNYVQKGGGLLDWLKRIFIGSDEEKTPVAAPANTVAAPANTIAPPAAAPGGPLGAPQLRVNNSTSQAGGKRRKSRKARKSKKSKKSQRK